ncbi:hypothetical protein JHK87_020434 [Glycine soja]|nr:hypothetical protein JHK87_020434 [Glycine soja]
MPNEAVTERKRDDAFYKRKGTRSFYMWLKPGGKILITDYCKSAGSPSLEFDEYIKKGGYYPHDIKAYRQEDYNEIVERWKAKQTRGASREQMWGLFIAKKN